MTYQDILDRLLEIQAKKPELLEQEAKYGHVNWVGDEAFTPYPDDDEPDLNDIDEMTLAYDPDADGYVLVMHP